MSAFVDPCSDPAWAALAAAKGSLFSSPSWLRVLKRQYDFDVRATTQLNGDRLAAGLPFVELDDMMGHRIVCVPFSDYCDPILDQPATWKQLVEPLLARGCPIKVRCAREDAPRHDPRFREVGSAFLHDVDLERDEEALWDGFHSTVRRHVRTADRAEVTIHRAVDRESAKAFQALHRDLRRDKFRLLPPPPMFYEHIWEEFSPSGDFVVLVAELEGETIGAMLLLVHDDALYYKFGASVPAKLDVRPNDRLMWEAIRYGQERKLRRLDLGISETQHEGLVRYKRKFATSESEVSFLRYAPEGHTDPRRDELGATLGALTELLTEEGVPDSVTERAGAQLYRYFC